ncbi:MAG: hypothetical protein PSV46_12960 [Reyranella sp.]|nr:hypothetical protein [Reyranella sp.]
MLQEFRRIAIGPIFVAAALAAILGALLFLMTDVGDPYRVTMSPAAGAIGGLIGAALMQARARITERRRAVNVLQNALTTLATSLESDADVILHPLADENGKLAWISHLTSYTGRATRSVQQIVALSIPAAVFSDDLNRDIELLRRAASDFTIFMDDVHRTARANPATVDEFHAALGPMATELPTRVKDITRLISAIESYRV